MTWQWRTDIQIWMNINMNLNSNLAIKIPEKTS